MFIIFRKKNNKYKMSQVFTNVGEFRRGKGNRKTRLGPRANMIGGIFSDKKFNTPDEIALKKLKSILNNKGRLNKKDKYEYGNLMIHADQLRFMNMNVLAEVMIYMNSIGDNFNQNTFNYEQIKPYIANLLPSSSTISLSDTDKEIIRLRMAATFMRYIKYIMDLRHHNSN